MGIFSSKLLFQPSTQQCCEHKKRKRKSKCLHDSETEEEEELEDPLNTPRRKKLKCTSKYIYQTLFLNGENSDIKICALGQEWNLHKIYLCQSRYFSSMFCGSWRESSMNVIELEIPDDNIDTEALQVTFGSLYRDDVLIKPSRVISVLAAACMLQLDGLIKQCVEIMKETINVQTVCGYSSAADVYGLDSVKNKCLEWLLNNLMTHQNVDLFKELSISMMKQLICSPDLLVTQVEMDVYTVLKKWMFLQLVPSWNGSLKELLPAADAWFSQRKNDLEENSITFLECEQGCQFVQVFRHLKLQYIISDLNSVRIVERDALIPSEWLSSVYKQQWFAMLRTEQDNDTGLRLSSFDSNGRIIFTKASGYQIMNFDKDQEQVVMNLDSRLLIFPLYICCNFLYTSSERRVDSESQQDIPDN
ncbi:germ cell-less protein-like 1 isoform X2 [Bombina bombina]|uniref:germ cell-less protein-like 1 isoform X2 n=1 Tax=Bombina bombina TaxID=8345 RepID=UPI00235A6B72|nr:germ cell-less protein-like 1 isoform X2 [Bombina bombina]